MLLAIPWLLTFEQVRERVRGSRLAALSALVLRDM
jgi:hypothetical protein